MNDETTFEISTSSPEKLYSNSGNPPTDYDYNTVVSIFRRSKSPRQVVMRFPRITQQIDISKKKAEPKVDNVILEFRKILKEASKISNAEENDEKEKEAIECLLLSSEKYHGSSFFKDDINGQNSQEKQKENFAETPKTNEPLNCDLTCNFDNENIQERKAQIDEINRISSNDGINANSNNDKIHQNPNNHLKDDQKKNHRRSENDIYQKCSSKELDKSSNEEISKLKQKEIDLQEKKQELEGQILSITEQKNREENDFKRRQSEIAEEIKKQENIIKEKKKFIKKDLDNQFKIAHRNLEIEIAEKRKDAERKLKKDMDIKRKQYFAQLRSDLQEEKINNAISLLHSPIMDESYSNYSSQFQVQNERISNNYSHGKYNNDFHNYVKSHPRLILYESAFDYAPKVQVISELKADQYDSGFRHFKIHRVKEVFSSPFQILPSFTALEKDEKPVKPIFNSNEDADIISLPWQVIYDNHAFSMPCFKPVPIPSSESIEPPLHLNQEQKSLSPARFTNKPCKDNIPISPSSHPIKSSPAKRTPKRLTRKITKKDSNDVDDNPIEITNVVSPLCISPIETSKSNNSSSPKKYRKTHLKSPKHLKQTNKKSLDEETSIKTNSKSPEFFAGNYSEILQNPKQHLLQLNSPLNSTINLPPLNPKTINNSIDYHSFFSPIPFPMKEELYETAKKYQYFGKIDSSINEKSLSPFLKYIPQFFAPFSPYVIQQYPLFLIKIFEIESSNHSKSSQIQKICIAKIIVQSDFELQFVLSGSDQCDIFTSKFSEISIKSSSNNIFEIVHLGNSIGLFKTDSYDNFDKLHSIFSLNSDEWENLLSSYFLTIYLSEFIPGVKLSTVKELDKLLSSGNDQLLISPDLTITIFLLNHPLITPYLTMKIFRVFIDSNMQFYLIRTLLLAAFQNASPKTLFQIKNIYTNPLLVIFSSFSKNWIDQLSKILILSISSGITDFSIILQVLMKGFSKEDSEISSSLPDESMFILRSIIIFSLLLYQDEIITYQIFLSFIKEIFSDSIMKQTSKVSSHLFSQLESSFESPVKDQMRTILSNILSSTPNLEPNSENDTNSQTWKECEDFIKHNLNEFASIIPMTSFGKDVVHHPISSSFLLNTYFIINSE